MSQLLGSPSQLTLKTKKFIDQGVPYSFDTRETESKLILYKKNMIYPIYDTFLQWKAIYIAFQ